MNIEDIRQKYQCDASQTFAQWKEWVRKNKPSQAQAHIVKAVAPNGSKYERLIGGYTDAQNAAFDLVSHGYKDVKLYHSVNAGPLKLLRNFSAPLHGAKFKDSVDFSQDKLLITANGFGNEKGVIKKDPRNGLKPFEVNFYIKGKDGKLIKTGRSKMAASLNEAKQWANSESRKYKNVAKVEVKEFRDSVDSADAVDSIREKYANDAAFGVKVKGNEKATERLTMEKVFKELSPAPAWKKVKKGNTIVIRTNINGKDQDVVTIKYFNPNIVAMTPKGGAANMVALKDVTVMCSKLGVEGRRSYMDSSDSVDAVDEIRNKYAMDAAMGIKISGNEKGTERLTMEKVFKEWLSPAAAWQKVKKGNTIMIRFNGNGPNKKLKGKDVLKIEYFNPNVVAMTPRSGGTQLVGLQRINVMAGKLASEGLRSYPEFENMLLKKDSADDFASDAVDGIRNKYQSDAVGAGVVNTNFKFQTNVEKRLATTRKGRAMTLPQYGKPSKVIVKKDGNSFSVIGKDGQKLNKNTFKSYEEAEKWARGNGWMVERR